MGSFPSLFALTVSITVHKYSALRYDERTPTVKILDDTKAYLGGKFAIVTGATSGLGRETVRCLAMVGCKVIMAVRDYDKALLVKQELIESITNDRRSKTTKEKLELNLIPMTCNLASFESIHSFATSLINNFPEPVDYLFNNAGIMALPQYMETMDGYERQIGVNHLGHYYLTRLLLPKLLQKRLYQRTFDQLGRVITISSRAHLYAPNPINSAIEMMEIALHNRDIMSVGYGAWENYGISKAFNILFARELQRREGYKGLISVSLHPGVIKSGLQKYLTEDFLKTKSFNKNIEHGTSTQLWCALMPQKDIVPGAYYDDCVWHDDRLRDDLKPMDGYLERLFDADELLENKLWEVSEHLIQKKGFSFDIPILKHDDL